MSLTECDICKKALAKKDAEIQRLRAVLESFARGLFSTRNAQKIAEQALEKEDGK